MPQDFAISIANRIRNAARAKSYRIVSESGWGGDRVVFEHADKWEIIRWFALSRPEPERVALDAGYRVEGPGGLVLSGSQIDKWIHDLTCSQCESGNG